MKRSPASRSVEDVTSSVAALVVVCALTSMVVSLAAMATRGVGADQSRETAPGVVFDLAAAENGGRIEWATSQYPPRGAAMNIIASATPHPGWSAGANGLNPEELVFSFFSRQSALVASVLVNPITSQNNDRPKDIEIWTSVQSPTAGFTRVAAATLKKEDSLQSVTFAPVEAKVVKLRIVNAYAPSETGKPGGFAMGVSRVKIVEGERAGYVSLLARNPELAALIKGVIPSAPETAAIAAPPAAGASTCAVPSAGPPKPSRFDQSKHVLVVADYPDTYRTLAWKSSETAALQSGRPVVPGVTFSWVTPNGATPAQLIAEPKVDTVVFAQICEINDRVSPAFKQALLAWLAAGHKLIIQDSDFCAGSRTPKYPFIPYPFATVNPGASGSKGEAGVLEHSTLVSTNPKDPAYINTDGWKAGPNDLGDSNVIVQYDARWCGAMWAKNKLQKNGMALAYARYGRGLMIYDGFDSDQFGNKSYQALQVRELLQPFDADHLPCSQPLGSFIITTTPGQRSQPMAAGRTYTYPIDVLGNFGYTGSVALETSIVPADPAVSVTLASPVADLTKLDTSSTSLTVTTGAAASLTSKVISVRGRDSAGKSNVLCLELPERRTGGVKVVSALRAPGSKPPTKNLEIILDASGSMKALLGKQTRWATAQAVLKDVVSKLPKDFSVGLRAYGHTLASTNPKTCTDTSLVVPVRPLNPSTLIDAAGKLAPRGETPLVYSILQTPGDLKSVGGGTVILITDGEESCKGDFAAAAKTLKDAGTNLTLNIVGFTLKNAPAQAALTGLAESTGGHYYPANSGDALARAILLAAVDRLPYRILNATGKEVARGEAGVDDVHELAPGAYTVVVMAGDTEVRTPLSVAVGQDITLRASIKGDRLVVER